MVTLICDQCEGKPCEYTFRKKDTERYKFFKHLPTICPWEAFEGDALGDKFTGETTKAKWRKK